MTTSKSFRLQRTTRRLSSARDASTTLLLDADERDELWPYSGLNDDLEPRRGLRALVAVRARQVEDEFEL